MQTYEGRELQEPGGPESTGWGPLQRLYRAADRWFFLGLKESQVTHLATIPGLEIVQSLAGEHLAATLAMCFQSGAASEWVHKLNTAGIGAHLLRHVSELMQEPWVIAHGLSLTRQHSDGTHITTIGPPARLSRTPVVPGCPVSPPGGDAEEILALLGLSDKLDKLLQSRAIALA